MAPTSGLRSWLTLALLAGALVWLVAAGPALAVTGAPETLLAETSPTRSKPTLTWGAPTAAGAGVAGYHVYRGATRVTTTPLSTGVFTDTALVANGSYAYTVKAVETGTGEESAASDTVTVVFDTVAPPAPTAAVAATPTSETPVLSWTAGAADATSGFSHHLVQRGAVVVAPSLTGTTFTDTTLTVSGSQAYTVKAVDRAGNVSAALSKTVVYDVVAPSTPAGFAPAPAQRTQPYLSWSAATDTGASGVDRYEVFRGGTRIGDTTSTSYTDGTVVAEGTYSYTVRAVDKAGNVGPPTAARSVLYDVTVPSAPTGLVTTDAVTKDKPALAWTASSDPGGSGVVAYRITRGGTTLAGSTPATVFSDTALTADGVHGYRVSAVDAAGNESAASTAVEVLFDKTAPPAPTALTGATPTAAKPVLTWSAGGADALSGFHHWEVFRGGVLVGTVTGTPTFTDTALTATGTQSYTVKAVDVAGNASTSPAARSVVYDPTPPGAPGALNAPAATRVAPVLTWTPAADTGGSTISHYAVHRDGVLLGTSTTASFTDSGAAPGAAYLYAVSAVDKAGNEGPRTAARTVVYDTVAPTAPTGTAVAEAVGRAKPIVSFTASGDGTGSGVVLYTVQRGATTAGTTTGTSFTDTALAANGLHTYTVRATDAAGNVSAPSTAVSATYDNVPPSVPSALTGPSPTGGPPTVSWTGSADVTSGLRHYEVYRGAVLLGTTTDTTYSDATLTAAGSNSYTVRALDLAGNLSAASVARAIVYDPTAPAAPTNLDATSPARQPKLSWTAPSDPAGIARYEVLRSGTSGPIGTTTTTTFTDGTVPTDGTYSYTVRAVDGTGNTSPASLPRTVVVDVTAPPAPTGLTAPAVTSSKPVLTWTSGGPDSSSGLKGYVVTRGGVKVGEPTGPSFLDTTATVSATLSYTVRALDNAGNESAAVGVSVVYDAVAPPAPVGLSAPARTAGDPTLTWFSGGADGLSGFDHYEVYRGAVRVGSPTGESFVDTGATADGTYAYTVRAVDAAGNRSAPTTAATVARDTTAPAVPVGLAAVSPTREHPRITWTASGDGVGVGGVTYLVYRDGSGVPVAADGTTNLAFTDATTPGDGTYSYTVRAVDAVGNASTLSTARTVRVDTVAPPAPTAVTGASPTNSPTLSWAAADDAATGASGIARYAVYRGGSLAGTSVVPTFTDTSAPINGMLTYTVTAVDGAGNESAASTPAADVLFDSVAPPAPTLAAPPDAIRSTKPLLTWTSGGADALSGFSHYEIFRNGVSLGSIGSATSFSDVALATNGVHVYTVRAVDAAGNRSVASASRSLVWDDTAPPVPAGLTVPTPTNRPSLSWGAVLDVGGAGLSGYRVLRDGVEIAAPATASFVDDDPLLAEGLHTYTVVAVDEADNASDATQAVTVRVDLTAPTVPFDLTGVSPTRVPAVAWSGSTDTDSGLSHYVLYRGTAVAGTVQAPATRLEDLAVTVDDTYLYSVRAVDRAGNRSPASLPLEVVFDHAAPPIPAGLRGASPSAERPVLSWSPGGLDNLSGLRHYAVYRDGVLVDTTTAPLFQDVTLSRQGAHLYTVRAVDRAGNESAASTTLAVIYDATAPPVPTAVGVTSPTNLPHLTWGAVSDDDTGASGIDHYKIYRDGIVAGVSAVTTFSDGSVPADGSYGYAVAAVDRAGNESLQSRTLLVVYDGTPPEAPDDLFATSPTRMPTLGWSPLTSERRGGTPVVLYRVWRDGAFVGETTGTSFSDGRVAVSGQYHYAVQAVDAAGNVGLRSPVRPVVYDAEGPRLENLTVPTARVVGDKVVMSVRPTDAVAGVNGAALWDFGDGTATGNTVSHVYREPGTYHVTVTATDTLGNPTTLAASSITIAARRGAAPAAPGGPAAPTGRKPPAAGPTATSGVVGAIRGVTAASLRRAGGRLRVPVRLPAAQRVRITVLRNGRPVASVVRRLGKGASVAAVVVPRSARGRGTLVVRVQGSRKARGQVTVRVG